MSDYINHKFTWKRCYTNNPEQDSFQKWIFHPEHWRTANGALDTVSANKPLHEALQPRLALNDSWKLTYSILPKGISELEFQFNDLATKWKAETGLFSIDRDRVNDTFLDIISLGKDIVPFILKDLQKPTGTARWHIALKTLTKANPVLNEELNKSKLIKERWIKWGKDKNII